MRAIVIGTGFGQRVAAPMYEQAGIEVEVVSPRDEAGVRQACAADVDFISVHSPPFMHREHVLMAIDNGRNVVCDKPFGRNAADAKEMLDAAESAGIIHLLNFEFRQEAIRRQARKLIDEGAIGPIKHLTCSAIMSASRMPLRNYGWLWNRELGGGWIGAFGSHIIDMFRVWAGEIETATGVCRNEIAIRPDKDGQPQLCTGEDAFSASLTFKSGATGMIDTAYAATISRPYVIEIFGDDGALLLDHGTRLELRRLDGEDQFFDFPPWHGDTHEPGMSAWAELVRNAITERRQIEPSFRDGLACAVVMDQIRENAVWISQA